MRQTINIVLLMGLLALAILLTGCRSTSQLETRAPEVEVNVAWDGYWQSPGWTEISVALTSHNDAPWAGQVRIVDKTQSTSYLHNITLGANGRTIVRIPMYLQKLSRPTVDLIQDNKVISSYGVEFTPTPVNSGICAIFGTKPTTPITRSAHCQTILFYDNWGQVPSNPLIWESLERIYITSALQSAGAPLPEHLTALEIWVSHGGQLFIFGETALAQIGSNQSWLAITKAESSGLHSIIPRAESDVVFPNEFLSATLDAKVLDHVSPLITSEQGLLAARQQYGWGTIDVAGWLINNTPEAWFSELDRIPFNTLPIPAGINDGGTLRGYYIEDIFLVDSVTNLPPALIIILMLLYVGVIGPGILIITKKRRQPLLSWTLIPAWIGVGIIVVNLVLRGTLMKAYPITGELAVLEYPLGTRTAKATQYLAIFAPNSSSVTWKATAYEKPLLGRYQGDYWYEAGDPYPIDITFAENDESMASMTAQEPTGIMTWSAVDYIPMPKLDIQLSVNQISGNMVQVQADIQSELHLHNMYLVYPDSNYLVYITEEIPAGELVDIEADERLRINEYNNGYLDYCEFSQGNGYYYSSISFSSPAAVSPAKFPEAPPTSYSGELFSVPQDGICHLVASADELPLSAQDLTQPTGKTCILIAISCSDLTP